MYAPLDEETVAIRDLVRDFAKRDVAPAAAGWDAADALPDAPVRALGELGILAVALSEDAGGSGLGPLELAVVCEELGAASGVLGHRVAGLAGSLALFAEVAPEHPVLASSAAGQTRLAGCRAHHLVGSGGGRWSGEVNPARRATTADRLLAIVRRSEGGEQLVLLDPTKGRVRRERRSAPLGLRGIDLGVLGFADARAESLGPVPLGAASRARALTRVGVAGVALGIARAAVAEGASYANARVQFGRPIADFQAISFKLADIATELDAARLLVHDAARAIESDADTAAAGARALLLAIGAAERAADEALQIHGGYGYTRDFPIERLWRDARALSALEGPPEALALEVSRAALGGA